MLYFELVGLPGSGKSSVARRMEKRYGWVSVREARRRYVASLSPQERAFHRALQALPRDSGLRRVWPRFEELGRFVFNQVDALAVVLEALNGLESDIEKVSGQVLRTLAEIGALRRYSAVDEKLIHDEGLQQRRVSLAMRGVRNHHALSRLSPEGTRVVLIDVPEDLATARLRRRGHPRRDTAVSAAALSEILENLGATYVTVDGRPGLDHVCDELEEAISY